MSGLTKVVVAGAAAGVAIAIYKKKAEGSVSEDRAAAVGPTDGGTDADKGAPPDTKDKAPTDTSVRAEQETPEGQPVVEEWGEESFPASDPPQSW